MGQAIEKQSEQRIDASRKAGNHKHLSAFFSQPSIRNKLAQVAEGFLTPEKMTQFVLIAASKNPLLFECSMVSILRSLMDAAALRIRPGGTLGRGYLVPRKVKGSWEVMFDPGWRGLVDIARRSGVLKSISAQVVRENDQFSWGHNPLPTLSHTPARGDRGAIVAAYAVAELMDGAIQIEVLEQEDIAAIRRSSASQNGPWKNWEAEMARKSAVKRICKYLPIPEHFEELERAVNTADAADVGDPMISIAEVPPEAEPERSALLPGREPTDEAVADELERQMGAEADEYPAEFE